jgi:diacylglycerol O-acyltransferase / wax synthase
LIPACESKGLKPMPNTPGSDRLTALDALFVYLEKKEMPLHIGSVSVVDGPIPLKRLQALMEAKLPLIARYRQRIVFSPLNIGHPTWEWDPDFDLQRHFHQVRLEHGTNEELEAVAGDLFGQQMDRDRPLWDMTVVDGLEGGRSALIARIHHCLVDGISGVALMNLLMDKTPKPPRFPKKQPFHAPPLPNAGSRLLDAVLTSYSEISNRMLSVQRDALDLAKALLDGTPFGSLDQFPGAMPFWRVERLPFNKPVLGPRKMAWTEFRLSDFKAIGKSVGAKVNDVALAVVTAAVREYCELHGHSMKGRSMRVMVPVSLRNETDPQGFGNQISLIPVQVPLDLTDPVALLHAIHRETEALKNGSIADVIALSAKFLAILPIPLQAAVGNIVGNVLPLPPWNMVCTNVPGPQFPLYLLGREVLTYYPYVPIGNDMGLCCAIESYNGKLFFNFSADSAAVPDLARLRDLLNETYAELREKSGVAGPMEEKQSRPRPAVAAEQSAPRPRRKRPVAAAKAAPSIVAEKPVAPAAKAPTPATLAAEQPTPRTHRKRPVAAPKAAKPTPRIVAEKPVAPAAEAPAPATIASVQPTPRTHRKRPIAAAKAAKPTPRIVAEPVAPAAEAAAAPTVESPAPAPVAAVA